MRNLFLVSFLWGLSQYIQVSTGQQGPFAAWDAAANPGGVSQGGTLGGKQQRVLQGILRGILTDNQGNYPASTVGGAWSGNQGQNPGGGGQVYQDNFGGGVASSQAGAWSANLRNNPGGLWTGGGQVYQDNSGGAVAGSQAAAWTDNSGGGQFGNQGGAQSFAQFGNQRGAQSYAQLSNQGGRQFSNQRNVQGAPPPVFNRKSQNWYPDASDVSQANVQNTNVPPPGQAYPPFGFLFNNNQGNVQNTGQPLMRSRSQDISLANPVPKVQDTAQNPTQNLNLDNLHNMKMKIIKNSAQNLGLDTSDATSTADATDLSSLPSVKVTDILSQLGGISKFKECLQSLFEILETMLNFAKVLKIDMDDLGVTDLVPSSVQDILGIDSDSDDDCDDDDGDDDDDDDSSDDDDDDCDTDDSPDCSADDVDPDNPDGDN